MSTITRPHVAARFAHTRNAVIEDVEFMLATGEHPINVATRAGYRNRKSLEDILRRWNRHDLANMIHERADEVPA